MGGSSVNVYSVQVSGRVAQSLGTRMLKVSNLSRFSKSLVFAGMIAMVGVLASCGGSIIGGPLSAEFVYIATGTNVAQYAVSGNGQLVALNPASATSVNAVAMATDPAGKYLYAVNRSANTISQFTVGGTGLLTAMTPTTIATGSSPTAVAVSRDGKFVFALNSADNTITGYTVGDTGLLTAIVATTPVAADGSTLNITPNGSYLYATSYLGGKIDAFSIGTDGSLTPLSTPSYTVGSSTGTSISPDGNFMYVPDSTNGVAQFSIGVDGSLTPLAPAVVAGPAGGNDTFAVTPDGKYGYLGSFNGGNPGSPVGQFSIGLNGALTPLAPASVAAGNAPRHIAIEPLGKFLYVANTNDGTVSQFTIGSDGTLTALSPSTVAVAGATQILIISR